MNNNLAIITVNYNSGSILVSNLKRMLDFYCKKKSIRFFIVDNNSTDDSCIALERFIVDYNVVHLVTLIKSPVNGGFSHGNNLGIKSAIDSNFNPAYFYLLNPDAYTLPEAIDQLYMESKNNNDNCILGSLLHNESLEARPSAFRFPNIISEFQRGAHLGFVDKLFPKSTVALPLSSSVTECDWVSGAGFFFSREVFNKIGYMDEDYFLYYEEVDYMLHAKKLGINVFSVPKSKIVHVAGVSTNIVGGKSENKPMPNYWYKSWHRFYFKNFNSIYAASCGIAWICGRLSNSFLSLFIKHRRSVDGHSISRFFKYGLLGKRHD